MKLFMDKLSLRKAKTKSFIMLTCERDSSEKPFHILENENIHLDAKS